MSDLFLCKKQDIPKNSSKGFPLPTSSKEDDANQDIFIVNRGGNFFAYKNKCPHTGASLNWLPDVFMDYDNFYIQCSIHAARFEVESGFCVWGPCANQSLMKIELKIIGDDIYLKES